MLLALFCCKGAVLPDVPFCACQDFQVLFFKAAFQLVRLQPVMLPEFFSSQVQEFALSFTELHKILFAHFKGRRSTFTLLSNGKIDHQGKVPSNTLK